MKFPLMCIAAVLVSGFAKTTDAANSVYWTDANRGKIQRANLDGSGVEDLVTDLPSPSGIALDVAGGKLYWTEIVYYPWPSGLRDYRIRRANLDGSSVEDLVFVEMAEATGIALDLAARKMYWIDADIHRANLDGTGQEVAVVANCSICGGIALDVPAGKVYWAHRSRREIRRANLDGTGIETVVGSEFVNDPRGIALDLDGGKLYWAQVQRGAPNGQRIQRANLDGSAVEVLVTDLNIPEGIALDLAVGKMYWTDADIEANDGHRIQRANLDGSEVEDVVTDLYIPMGIALQLNDPPVATDDAATVEENSSGNPIPVLANDSDVDGDSLAIVSVSTPAHGTTMVAGQHVLYSPQTGYSGDDSFTYSVGDGHATDTAAVAITVTALPRVSFLAAQQTVSESPGSVAVTLVLSKESSEPVTVPFAVAGTAGSADYGITASPLTFAAGSTQASITVTPVDDAQSEPDETVVITLVQPTNAALGNPAQHTLTIGDNDPPPSAPEGTPEAPAPHRGGGGGGMAWLTLAGLGLARRYKHEALECGGCRGIAPIISCPSTPAGRAWAWAVFPSCPRSCACSPRKRG